MDENFYQKHRESYVQYFSALYNAARLVLSVRFTSPIVDNLEQQSRKIFDQQLFRLPYIGGEGSGTNALILCATLLSIGKPLETLQLPMRDIAKVLYDTALKFYQMLPSDVMEEKKKGFFHGYLEVERKRPSDQRERKYPFDFITEYVPGKAGEFDCGLNYHECALAKYLKSIDEEKYLPLMCLSDYALFKVMKVRFFRNMSISQGDPMCTFRWSKKGETADGWPPESLPEWKITL
jgi:hypothetical protein